MLVSYWDEKHYIQLSRRHGYAYVRSLMADLRAGTLTTVQAADALGVTDRRVRSLYASYLLACASGQSHQWSPGKSGGHRKREFPSALTDLWRRMLKVSPPAPYAFLASEALRHFEIHVDRATVRRWAIRHTYAHPATPPPPRAEVRRWQSGKIGAIWQLDMSPHAWFGPRSSRLPLLDLVDDCSRRILDAHIYPRECLLAYVDLFDRAFRTYGLPSLIYVDYHSFFFSHVPETRTYLGEALHRYGVSFKYAPTPQAKGKVERLHQYWQRRLPSYCLAHGIDSIEVANQHLDALREHHNAKEVHRELGMTPQTAWDQALKEKRSVLRPFQEDPWWRYIWSVRQQVRVSPDGTVPIGHLRQRIPGRYNGHVLLCRHPNGSITILSKDPEQRGRPFALYRYEGTGPDWSV